MTRSSFDAGCFTPSICVDFIPIKIYNELYDLVAQFSTTLEKESLCGAK